MSSRFHALFLLVLAAVPAVMAEEPAGPVQLDFNLYMQGRYVYERNCIVCHGPRGDGKGEFSPTLVPKPRSFREGMFKFRTTPLGMLPTDDDLRRTIKGGLSGTAMVSFDKALSETQRWDIIAYIFSIRLPSGPVLGG